jgi:hypothetical protein
MFDNLRSPGGTQFFADQWIPGTKHPALPPRPERWKFPKQGEPLPFPWECQLNPFLVHHQFGASSLTWDIANDLFGILFNNPNEVTIPLDLPDRMQPATWPFVTHMWINAVADDPAPAFSWPIMVENPHGVLCEDVFAALYKTLHQYVSPTEVDRWTWIKQEEAHAALLQRVRQQRMNGEEIDEDMRRVDYFGRHCMFRGLSSNPNKETPGWVLHIGHG